MNAAPILGRGRRRVLVCDTGQPRNAVSKALHGFLSRDGVQPADLRRLARQDLSTYPNVTFRQTAVVDATRRAAGDASRHVHLAIVAAAEGAMAAFAINAELLEEDRAKIDGGPSLRRAAVGRLM